MLFSMWRMGKHKNPAIKKAMNLWKSTSKCIMRELMWVKVNSVCHFKSIVFFLVCYEIRDSINDCEIRSNWLVCATDCFFFFFSIFFSFVSIKYFFFYFFCDRLCDMYVCTLYARQTTINPPYHTSNHTYI